MSLACSRPAGRLFYCLISVLVAVGVSRGAPPPPTPPATTTISDVIYRADGSTAAGTLLITWPAFTTADNRAVPAGSMSLAIGPFGAINLALVPNQGATPPGTYYKVVMKLNDGTTSEEFWVVPTLSPTTISAIRSQVVPAGVALQVVTRQYVDGQLATKADNAGVVHRTGDESVGGVKQFSSSPTVPTPTTDAAAANKAYADSTVSAVGDNLYVRKSGDAMTGALTTPNLNNVRFVSQLVTGGAGTVGSPWTGWETPLNALAANLHIHFPAGFYTQTSAINMKRGWTVTGDGPANVTITSSFAGSAFKTISPINSSTAVNIDISGIAITNTSATPTGACIENVGGTFFYVHNVWLTGCKYNIILDQAEIVSIYDSILEAPKGTNSGNIWLTNGADRTAGANPGFTNRISILRNQFNNVAGVGIQIIDDGGGDHWIAGNNFNSGLMVARFANVLGLVLENNESEGHLDRPYQWFATTLVNGTYVGLSSGLSAQGNTTVDSGVGSNFSLDFLNGGVISGNYGATTGGNGLFSFKNGASNQATGLTIQGNTKLITGSFKTSGGFVDGFGVAVTRNNIRQDTQTYVASGHAGGAQTVTPATPPSPLGYGDVIAVGQKLFVMNADGTNPEDVTVTATTGTTFTATFASSKSTNWLVYGIYGPGYNGTVFNATSGFQVSGAAASGNVLRGNGSNFVSAQLAALDLSNGVTGTGAVVLANSPTLTTPNIGNAVGSISGNAATATALAVEPADCSGNNFALGINAAGVAQCAQPAFSNLSGTATSGQLPATVVYAGQSNTYTAGTQDFESAGVTRPFRRLAFASFPATCTANREFLQRSDPAAAGQVLYACNSAGNGWNLLGDGGATTALDNLASVAVNASLIPGASGTLDLGSSSLGWKNFYTKGVAAIGPAAAGFSSNSQGYINAGLNTVRSLNSATVTFDSNLAGVFEDNTTNSISAVRAMAEAQHTAGTKFAVIGVSGDVFASGSGGTTLNLAGLNASTTQKTGTTVDITAGLVTYSQVNLGATGISTGIYGVWASGSNLDAAITVPLVAGVRIDPNTKTAGTITNNIGLDIASQTAGATNYAIRTGAGLVSLGDTTSAPVFNATTGYRVGGAAAAGNVLRGNGTNFVGATLACADVTNCAPLVASGTAGVGPSKAGSASTAARGDHDHRSHATLTWHFPGTPSTGVSPMILAVPQGIVNGALLGMQVTVGTTSSSTFNLQRCTANCTGTSPTFSNIYSSDNTLSANTSEADFGTTNLTTTLNAKDQFKANLVTIGSGLANVTITLTYKYDTTN